MARVLIVGCGCRGRELADLLRVEGHAVRGTSRTEEGRALIETAGHEGVIADPDRAGTVLMALSGVSVVVWLLANATGANVADLHGTRLRATLERLIDAGVRGLVYESRGAVGEATLAAGRAEVEAVHRSHSMPVAFIDADPGNEWKERAAEAVESVLTA